MRRGRRQSASPSTCWRVDDVIPVLFAWTDDGVMKPLGRFSSLCDRQFVVGEHYRLEVVQERSPESHRQYFAVINEAWANLPEIHAGRWRTPDHLRKWALVTAGFCDETTFIAQTKAEAQRFAAFIGALDQFAVVTVDGKMVRRATAKSQSYKDMSRKEFQASKDAVFQVLAKLIGVDERDLVSNAGRAA